VTVRTSFRLRGILPRSKLQQVVEEQKALRRVATLIAHGVPPAETFAAVAAEVGRVLAADHTNVIRYEPDNTATVVGHWSDPRLPQVGPPLDGHWPVEDGTVTGAIWATGRAARITDYSHATSLVGAWARSIGIRCVVGCPVEVEGTVWGAMTMHSLETEAPRGTEDHMLEFVELISTAIANAQVRSDLLASRARIVAAADEGRRRIERDLHDGAQQQLITLALTLQQMKTSLEPTQEGLKEQLSGTVDDLSGILTNLQEISRGLAPRILTTSGLPPALRSLARRSPVPVLLDVRIDRRLPEPIETAIYYTVSEALTNVTKHAQASEVGVRLAVENGTIRVGITDNGVGGAAVGAGCGLVGLQDRIETLEGRFQVSSPAGVGTSLLVDIPIGDG
jgi:signal transduction histidine kinase